MADEVNIVELKGYRRKDADRQPPTPLVTDDGGPHHLGMERLAKLEGVVDGLKAITPVRTAAIIAFTAAVIGGFALMIALITRTDSRMETRAQHLDAKFDAKFESLNTKVDALPEQINTSIREANRAFSDAVNTSLNVFSQRLQATPASATQPPIIIQVPSLPAPTPPAAPKP